MAMTKDQTAARDENVAVLMEAFPALVREQAVRLQNKLYAIAYRVAVMEARCCSEPNLDDLRTNVRNKAREDVKKTLAKFNVECSFNLSTDARGHGLWLHLPTGRYNSMGGEESGWGF